MRTCAAPVHVRRRTKFVRRRMRCRARKNSVRAHEFGACTHFYRQRAGRAHALRHVRRRTKFRAPAHAVQGAQNSVRAHEFGACTHTDFFTFFNFFLYVPRVLIVRWFMLISIILCFSAMVFCFLGISRYIRYKLCLGQVHKLAALTLFFSGFFLILTMAWWTGGMERYAKYKSQAVQRTATNVEQNDWKNTQLLKAEAYAEAWREKEGGKAGKAQREKEEIFKKIESEKYRNFPCFFLFFSLGICLGFLNGFTAVQALYDFESGKLINFGWYVSVIGTVVGYFGCCIMHWPTDDYQGLLLKLYM